MVCIMLTVGFSTKLKDGGNIIHQTMLLLFRGVQTIFA